MCYPKYLCLEFEYQRSTTQVGVNESGINVLVKIANQPWTDTTPITTRDEHILNLNLAIGDHNENILYYADPPQQK